MQVLCIFLLLSIMYGHIAMYVHTCTFSLSFQIEYMCVSSHLKLFSSLSFYTPSFYMSAQSHYLQKVFMQPPFGEEPEHYELLQNLMEMLAVSNYIITCTQ